MAATKTDTAHGPQSDSREKRQNDVERGKGDDAGKTGIEAHRANRFQQCEILCFLSLIYAWRGTSKPIHGPAAGRIANRAAVSGIPAMVTDKMRRCESLSRPR